LMYSIAQQCVLAVFFTFLFPLILIHSSYASTCGFLSLKELTHCSCQGPVSTPLAEAARSAQMGAAQTR